MAEIGGHFALEFAGHGGDDVVHQTFHCLRTHGPLLAGFLKAGQQFFAGEFFPTAVAFYNHEVLALNLLVGGEAVAALEAFPAALDKVRAGVEELTKKFPIYEGLAY